MRIWFGVFVPTRFVPNRLLRWYAYGHIDPDCDGAWFYPLGWNLVAGAVDWFMRRVWWPALRRVADAGHMDVNDGEVMSLSKIRLRRVREPYQRVA